MPILIWSFFVHLKMKLFEKSTQQYNTPPEKYTCTKTTKKENH